MINSIPWLHYNHMLAWINHSNNSRFAVEQDVSSNYEYSPEAGKMKYKSIEAQLDVLFRMLLYNQYFLLFDS